MNYLIAYVVLGLLTGAVTLYIDARDFGVIKVKDLEFPALFALAWPLVWAAFSEDYIRTRYRSIRLPDIGNIVLWQRKPPAK